MLLVAKKFGFDKIFELFWRLVSIKYSLHNNTTIRWAYQHNTNASTFTSTFLNFCIIYTYFSKISTIKTCRLCLNYNNLSRTSYSWFILATFSIPTVFIFVIIIVFLHCCSWDVFHSSISFLFTTFSKPPSRVFFFIFCCFLCEWCWCVNIFAPNFLSFSWSTFSLNFHSFCFFGIYFTFCGFSTLFGIYLIKIIKLYFSKYVVLLTYSLSSSRGFFPTESGISSNSGIEFLKSASSFSVISYSCLCSNHSSGVNVKISISFNSSTSSFIISRTWLNLAGEPSHVYLFVITITRNSTKLIPAFLLISITYKKCRLTW